MIIINISKMNQLSKDELTSFFNTFLAVFLTVGLPQILALDWNNATKPVMLALGIAVVRSVVKATSEKFLASQAVAQG
jgi:hypothetical protein